MIKKNLFNIDYLVFSSHKTATQSLVATFTNNNLRATHGHVLRHLDFKKGDFDAYVKEYSVKNNNRLNIVTVFREPVERCISSFFQSYGSDFIDFGHVSGIEETVLYNYNFNQLKELFLMEISGKKLRGYDESVDILFNELEINWREEIVNSQQYFKIIEKPCFKIYFIKFDRLINAFDETVSQLINRNEILSIQGNISKKKWYNDIYLNFKEKIRISPEISDNIYEDKRSLINFFYPNEFDRLKNTIKELYQ
jgi:hypothetical protein